MKVNIGDIVKWQTAPSGDPWTGIVITYTDCAPDCKERDASLGDHKAVFYIYWFSYYCHKTKTTMLENTVTLHDDTQLGGHITVLT